MCSLSWSRTRDGLIVVMNRDERRDRPPALPPRPWRGGPREFTAPVDGGAGGTWIAVRPDGSVLALLNHQGPAGAVGTAESPPTSRGLLVSTLAAEARLPDARRLRAAGLERFAPFRLFVAGPTVAPRVFTWNGVRLTRRRLHGRLGFLTSSSWNPRAVIPARQAAFRAFARATPHPTRAQLVAFHQRADHPRGTPWAICMARDDARTVSRTVVTWNGRRASMRYDAAPAG